VSIATEGRIKALERQVEALQALIDELTQRIAAIENRPKPGRPPKNG
jgi:prefoldin subunit 5